MRNWIAVAVVMIFAIGCAKKDSGTGGAASEPTPAPGLTKEEIASRKKETAKKLREIGLAFHSYADVNAALPVGSFARGSDQLGLSWRVMILPYLDEAQLFTEFKLEEPWDSEHNKKLIARMPNVYKSGGPADLEGKTHFRGFGGQGVLAVMPRPNGYTGPFARGIPLQTIQDGTSNTILVAELSEPVIWTKPDNLDYDGKQPLPTFGGTFEDGFHILMADGTVRFLPPAVPEATLRALITRSGGETIRDLPGEEIIFPKPAAIVAPSGSTSRSKK